MKQLKEFCKNLAKPQGAKPIYVLEKNGAPGAI
jgi:hypothetical protein